MIFIFMNPLKKSISKLLFIVDLGGFKAFGAKVWKSALDDHFKKNIVKISGFPQKPKIMQRKVGFSNFIIF